MATKANVKKNYSNWKIGSKVKLVGAPGMDPNLAPYIGQIFTITSFCGATCASATNYMDVGNETVESLYALGFTPYCKYFELCPMTIDNFKEEIKILQDKINDHQLKIDFLIESGLSAYDETQVKIY